MAWKTSHLELACSRAWPLAVATHGILAHCGRNTMAAIVDGYPAAKTIHNERGDRIIFYVV